MCMSVADMSAIHTSAIHISDIYLGIIPFHLYLVFTTSACSLYITLLTSTIDLEAVTSLCMHQGLPPTGESSLFFISVYVSNITRCSRYVLLATIDSSS